MHNHKGFTLIELVVIIVILGILAVLAAPRFLNLQTDARVAVLQGAKGALSGADGIVYGKAVIEGKEFGMTILEVNGKGVSIHHGHASMFESNIQSIMDSDLQVTNLVYTSGDYEGASSGVAFYDSGKPKTQTEIENSKCYLHAKNSLVKEKKSEIEYELVIDGC